MGITNDNSAVGLIDRAELLKAMNTWDKFGNDANEGLIPLSTPALQDRYVPYVKYEDMVNCVIGMPPATLRPCNDAVSRKDVVKILGRIEQRVFDGEGFDYEEARAEIDDLLPVTPQEPRWIPVSERLPEETIKVLVQSEDVYYNIGENSHGIIIGWRNGQYWSTYTVKGIELIKYPVAWMPLPESYKAEGEEMSSISATMYGQIIEEVKINVDTDPEQTENSEQ